VLLLLFLFGHRTPSKLFVIPLRPPVCLLEHALLQYILVPPVRRREWPWLLRRTHVFSLHVMRNRYCLLTANCAAPNRAIFRNFIKRWCTPCSQNAQPTASHLGKQQCNRLDTTAHCTCIVTAAHVTCRHPSRSNKQSTPTTRAHILRMPPWSAPTQQTVCGMAMHILHGSCLGVHVHALHYALALHDTYCAP
jgi:hypothetical protein